MKYNRIAHLLAEGMPGASCTVCGWLRTRRDAKGFSFLEINDGSGVKNLQVIADSSLANYQEEILSLTTGSSLAIIGTLRESPAKGQQVELKAEKIAIYGLAPADYPLQKKRHSFEFLRQITHLRSRTNSLGAVARVRSFLSFAIHRFFQEKGFFYIHTPIISTSDCEGAGEMFTVTAFDLANVPRRPDGTVAMEQDFFGRQANLTVSGQLEAEIYALSLGNVYTFGPTFRAENSNTSRHLAEFWMIEPEMAFCDLKGDIDLAEELLKFLVRESLLKCQDDMELFSRYVDPDLLPRLQTVLEGNFIRLSYTDAVAELRKSGKNFQFPVSWGIDLQSEHERFLTEEIYCSPVIITDYPKEIKPFYMRRNDDGKTVAAMDILFPSIGEIIGGSQREERFDVLAAALDGQGLQRQDYQWYLDLRKFGTAPHAGFGLGFERIVQFITGMANIREVIPFPRTPGAAGF